ncbi:hypothetical protein RD792_003400 [Penstemon davidsonii]|uniref:Pentatricopeptide repeat-containing protein n=1 Tax=Penstemon davidsonii TaxID=160366 RepID=A0ABR0DU59_9LAMI|nr:hypothetical protein RD792_003400 [Penstemon davidsonii]
MHKNSILLNNYSFPFVLKALADLKLMKEGTLVHAQIVKVGFSNDIYVGNSLLNLYAASGDMGLCGKVFDEMLLRDVVSWTVMISGFKESGRFDEALIVFGRMRSEGVAPNQVTVVNALAACACFGALDMGVWIHEHVKRNGWELDVILGTSLIVMYGKCGKTEEALFVFDEMKEKNVFTWNAVIKGLALSKGGKEAIRWFFRMEEKGIQPDEVTLISVLCACAQSGFVHMGRRIFSLLADGKFGFPPNVKHYACMVDLLARSRTQANVEFGEIAAWKLVELEPQNSPYYVVLSNLYAKMGKWSDVEKFRNLMRERGLKKDMGSSAVGFEHQEHALDSVAGWVS